MGDKKSAPAAPLTKEEKMFPDAGSALTNKTGEPPFKLFCNLRTIEFKCTDDRKPVAVYLLLRNPTDQPITFKVRCTSAEIFRVQPPVGLVKPNETVPITIWFQNQEKKEAIAKNHYFAFYHAKGDGRTPREVWANNKPDGITGVRRLPAIFVNLK